MIGGLYGQDVKQGLLNKLLASGPLIEGHKDLEKTGCLSCHDAGKGVPNTSCLNCHKEVKESIERKKTFHGLASLKKSCIECHSDHKGRDFDSTKIDTKNFNHESTGHPLMGKHQSIKCIDCHKEVRSKMAVRKEGIRFMGASSSCKSCHQKDDVHLFKGEYANKDCNSCHNESKWKPVEKFDHFKESGFKLEGSHQQMACYKCHTPGGEKKGPAVYKWDDLKKDNCLTCHKPYHQGTLSPKFAGGQCTQCHDQKSWKIPKFNHALTGLVLKGKHAETTCLKCHQQPPTVAPVSYKLREGEVKMIPHKWMGLTSTCISCHKDIHQSKGFVSKRFGRMDQCQTCHNERSFKEGVNFNHTLDTRFKIDGKHKELTCVKCHTPTDPQDRDSARIYHFNGLEKDNCVICHKSPHLKTFSAKALEKRCASCHVTTSWKDTQKSERFNHDTDTRFLLEGKHARMECKSCHKEGAEKVYKFNFSEKQFCESCHTNVHKNQFSERFASKSCLECHNAESFKDLKKIDHNKTDFPLEGKHQDPKVSCVQCHKPTKDFIVYKGIKVRPKGIFKFEDDKKGLCKTCHTNVHLGQFSEKFADRACKECHGVESFKDFRKFDHSWTDFSLDGKHADPKVSCSSCHRPTKDFIVDDKGTKLRPKGLFKFPDDQKDRCVICHTNVHVNQFSQRSLNQACTVCHSTQSFHQRKKFDHNATSFPLVDFHERAKCSKCHLKTNQSFQVSKNPMHRFYFKGLAENNCKTCHKDVHKGEFGNNCKECHSESKKWKIAQDFHKDFLLTGVHYTLKCNECHKDQRRLGGMSETCLVCHQKDDVHHRTLPNCKECHRQEFWEVTTFKHSLTSFPLRGSHRVLSCDSCHSNGMYQGKSSECISCHLKDKSRSSAVNHNIAGFENCSTCHNQFVFK